VPEDKIPQRYYRSLRLLTLAVHEVDRIVLYDNSSLLRHTAEGDVAGRAFCDIRNNIETAKAEITVLPPIPLWAFSHALLPFSPMWAATTQFRQTQEQFGEQSACPIVADLHHSANRELLLNPFLMA
jgi:hypothetical protein